MKFIYIRGGSKTAPIVAAAAGWEYGIRHDYTAYAPVIMLDVDFHNFTPNVWHGYLKRVQELNPQMALVPDYGRLKKHTVTRYELYSYIHDLILLGVPEILICPKFEGAIQHIPKPCIIALSVPAPTYAGFLPEDFSELAGRRVHLLGGNVFNQARLIMTLQSVGATIYSIDGSHHALKAGNGQYFDGGRWVQTPPRSTPTIDLETISARNIKRYLEHAATYQQPMLL